jgi:hypothetical protein
MTTRWGRLFALCGPVLLCWSGMALAEASPRERFTAAITEINAQLGPIEAVKAPPAFSDPANRARYQTVRETIEMIGTDAFPVSGMESFDAVCAPINEATVKHMFVGTAALKQQGLTQAQLAPALTAAMNSNARLYQNETVRLTVANLRCMTAHFPALSRFTDGLKPDEFTAIRRDGLEKMGKGLANTVFGLATQSLAPGSLPENSQMALDAAVRHAPDVVAITLPATRLGVIQRMAMLEGRVPAAYKADFLKVKTIMQDASCSGLCARLRDTAPPPGTPPLAPR